MTDSLELAWFQPLRTSDDATHYSLWKISTRANKLFVGGGKSLSAAATAGPSTTADSSSNTATNPPSPTHSHARAMLETAAAAAGRHQQQLPLPAPAPATTKTPSSITSYSSSSSDSLLPNGPRLENLTWRLMHLKLNKHKVNSSRRMWKGGGVLTVRPTGGRHKIKHDRLIAQCQSFYSLW